MKAAQFDIARPATLAEACRLIAEGGGDARAIAGGQSLGPMLNLRLASPGLLVDLTGLEELARLDAGDDALVIGACVTTASIEDGAERAGPRLAMLSAVARGVAYRAIRTRGTVGGSVCHADPAADWPVALIALGAECRIVGSSGRRSIPLESFVRGAFDTALASGEILEAIVVPRPSAAARWGWEKITRRTGKFALALAAAFVDPARGVRRMVVSGAGRPLVLEGPPEEAAKRIEPALEAAGISDPAERRWRSVALARAGAKAAA